MSSATVNNNGAASIDANSAAIRQQADNAGLANAPGPRSAIHNKVQSHAAEGANAANDGAGVAGSDHNAQPAIPRAASSHGNRRDRKTRVSHRPPAGATVVTSYADLKELLKAFAAGLISLLAIVARPGLGKSQLVKKIVTNQPAVIIKLRKSALDFYTDLYAGKDLPVVLDDADNLMSQPLCREYVKVLTETDAYKRLGYGTKTKILQQEKVPKYYYTTSSVCLIVNHWNSHDPILHALESRAEFIYFDPPWCEVYREIGDWFWDQSIYDHLRKRLDTLKEPDMRLVVKAYNRKKAGLVKMGWKKLIDDYVDDPLGLAVRRLLDDARFETNDARAEAFVEETKAHRATFYRRLAEIKRYRPSKRPERIILRHTAPPTEERPADGPVPGGDAGSQSSNSTSGKSAAITPNAPTRAADDVDNPPPGIDVDAAMAAVKGEDESSAKGLEPGKDDRPNCSSSLATDKGGTNEHD